MWVVLVLCFSLGRVAGYLYIYLAVYMCIIHVHVCTLDTYIESRACIRVSAADCMAGRTAPPPRENCIHSRERPHPQPRNNPAGILSGISRPYWNGDSPRAGNLNADKCIVTMARVAAGWCFVAMLMITLKRFRGGRGADAESSRILLSRAKQSRHTECHYGGGGGERLHPA